LAKSRVLLVDDFEDARELYAACLRSAGYETLEAATGLEALAMAQDQLPDLILMDLALPGMDGWEVTSRLKQDPQTRHIPIIALTAHALESERERTRQVGCDGFLTKPCLPPELVGEVARMLGRTRRPESLPD
jgi:CheY-like chemotaxis protein